MQQLNLPPYPFKIKSENGRKQIFDEIRKKYVALTPEEWVRQHFIKYLIHEKNYPEGLIVIEASLSYNTLIKRSDIVAYNRLGNPILIVECKAPGIKLNQDVFDQAAMYNLVLKVGHIIITNGLSHYCCTINNEKSSFEFLKEIPKYKND